MRSGATLKGEKRERWREVSAELDSLTLVFGQNVQKATGTWKYQLNPETDLAGLPGFVTEALKQKDYQIGLLATDYRPFMTYSSRRDLRELLYKAYNSRCVGGEFDNTENIRKIATLRQEKADLLGYETFADLRLTNTMAHTPNAVNSLLNQLLKAYKQPALNDVKEVAALAAKDGVKNLQLLQREAQGPEVQRQRCTGQALSLPRKGQEGCVRPGRAPLWCNLPQD